MENKKSNKKLKEIKKEFEKVCDVFNVVQSSLVEIEDNIKRNKSIVEALEADNKRLQEEINNIQVDEKGNINLEGIDEISDRISSNNRKIEIVKKVVSNFENKLEYMKLTEYNNACNDFISASKKYYKDLFDCLLADLWSDEFKEKLSQLFYISEAGNLFTVNETSISEQKNGFFDEIKKGAEAQLLQAENIDLSFLAVLPKIKYNIVSVGFSRVNRLNELKNMLS